MRQWIYSVFFGVLITAVLIIISIALTALYGDKCWAQRLGSIIVGFGLVIEAYALFDPKRGVIGSWKDDGPNPIIIKTAITTAIFGTILWGFGDLILQPYGYCSIQ